MATKSVHTEADLLAAPRDGQKYELVDGEIRVSPAGVRHGAIAMQLGARMVVFANERRLGQVLDSSTGFRLPSGNVRSPDLSFVAAGRWPEGELPEGLGDLAPDLVVEILSPQDGDREVHDKIGEYLQAGVRVVWIIDPKRRRAAVHRSLTDVREVREEDVLDGQDVLPGFTCQLADILG